MINHTLAVNDAIMLAIDYLVEEMTTELNFIKKIQMYILIIGSVIGGSLILLMAFLEVRMLKKQKSAVSRSFLTLHKHAVSNIVESLKINVENEEDLTVLNSTEVGRNKQEENYLAMLASTSESSTASSLPLQVLFLFAVLSIFLFIGCLVYQYYYLQSAAEMIRFATPHAANLPGSYLSGLRCVLSLLRIGAIKLETTVSGSTNKYQFPGDTLDPLVSMLKKEFSELKTLISTLRVGNDTQNLAPVVSLDSTIHDDYHKPSCTLQYSQYSNKHSFYMCFSPDMMLGQLEAWLGSIIGQIIEEGTFNINDGGYMHVWHIMCKHLYEDFVEPFEQYVTVHAFSFFSSKINMVIGMTVIFLVLIVICTFVQWWSAKRIEHEAKWMLELLLHCPPDVILASKQLVRVLGGDFSDHHVRTVEHDTHFYENIVEKFVDSVIVTDANLVCTRANPATERIFGKSVIGLKLTDIIPEESDAVLAKRAPKSSRDSKKDLGNINGNQDKKKKKNEKVEEVVVDDGECGSMREFMKMYRRALDGAAPLKISQDVEIEKEEGSVFLNLSLTAMGKSGILQAVSSSAAEIDYLVIVARNITQSIRSKRLLREEKNKSDALLRHILPPMIVEGLQRGETDISFTVPSASILFLDIVEFTPWCASLQASQVMSTLNRLFCEFDNLIANYETLTKIKCIGDCYMAAGGIFAGKDDCQPSKHATQMVSFGLDAIHAIERVNEEIEQNLRIRVGINTGGPIVAGVLGVDRPTFEIFGPAINMAQQMEHHGVPMNVHISQSVYELVFAGNFKIKERGQIEVKQGIVTTYIVSP